MILIGFLALSLPFSHDVWMVIDSILMSFRNYVYHDYNGDYDATLFLLD